MVPILLVTGFLGSGKTTLLKEILRSYGNNKKIAIVQNDFAPVNVDSAELSREFDELTVLEVNNGSLFCVCKLASFITQSADFIDKHNPDMLIIEASGLADPIAVTESFAQKPLSQKAYLQQVWTLVDANHIQNLTRVNTRVKHQIQVADLIIINKAEGINPVEPLQTLLSQLNPLARQCVTDWCKIPVHEMESLWEKRLSQHKIEGVPEKRPLICTAVYQTPYIYPAFNAAEFFSQIPSSCLRVKGVVKIGRDSALMVQKSFDQETSVPLSAYTGGTELVAISEAGHQQMLADIFLLNKQWKNQSI